MRDIEGNLSEDLTSELHLNPINCHNTGYDSSERGSCGCQSHTKNGQNLERIRRNKLEHKMAKLSSY